MKQKSDQKGPDVDMLGAPVDQVNEKWGAPSRKFTEKDQELVIALRAFGKSQEEIARELGCDPKTLRKNFSRELDRGAGDLENEAMMQAVRAMREGKLWGFKIIMENTKGGAAVAAGEGRSPEQDPPAEDAAPAEKLGKKEETKRAAGRPGGGWSDRLNRSGRLN